MDNRQPDANPYENAPAGLGPPGTLRFTGRDGRFRTYHVPEGVRHVALPTVCTWSKDRGGVGPSKPYEGFPHAVLSAVVARSTRNARRRR